MFDRTLRSARERTPSAWHIVSPRAGHVRDQRDIAIDITVPKIGGKPTYTAAHGAVTLACPNGCTLGYDRAKLQPLHGDALAFEHLQFDRVYIHTEIANGHVELTGWQLDSKDVSLRASLTISLADHLDDSTLEGCVRFAPAASLAARDSKTAAVIATTGALQGPDGAYSIKIARSGTEGCSARFAPRRAPALLFRRRRWTFA